MKYYLEIRLPMIVEADNALDAQIKAGDLAYNRRVKSWPIFVTGRAEPADPFAELRLALADAE